MKNAGFLEALEQITQEKYRAEMLGDRETLRELRAEERRLKAEERLRAQNERESKRLHAEGQAMEVEERNFEIESQLDELDRILTATLAVDDHIDFASLEVKAKIPRFQPGKLAVAIPAPTPSDPGKPPFLAKFLKGPRAKFEARVAELMQQHEQALVRHASEDEARLSALADAENEHARMVEKLEAEAAAKNEEVRAFREKFEAGDPEAIVGYFSMVLDASQYPDGFSKRHRMAFVPKSKQLVIEYELPGMDVVPTVKGYKYVKSRDVIEERARPAAQIKKLYADVIVKVTLRSVHELFEADRDEQIDTVVFNGFVDTINAATGQPEQPHLVTVRASREQFMAIDLAKVDPHACLKGLNAAVSKNPAELAPVRPIVEFNMVDSRFIEESDVLSSLDQRPNLMELSPGEFENLITNLFSKMGLDTKLTQSSRDGGVDCVAFDPRPIFGGKVVIQAKRYKNTVGVSAVRDLYGTMQNEGASKGILVTTSGYGKASFEFADGKPIELLSGSNLLYLLEEHAGMKAKIEAPADWAEPAHT